ncbi:class I SAM-dependent methyltransferase [Natronorubrum daqingense]|uniref:Methyltransferase domain-containing protein n=1 Tax=Natronorubrum daqingense TaxID=588898 RepID=A0A1N7CHC7_9EURY|nr:methyltransferase domain-containing protein [Natronorubrum daqingense]APX98204.1 SAM-dependent methyltransferase [Natronorubrum daqingense]SIR62970.1 Methyltransferase domain-containing protein [Natronorubrum daqingense]
MREFSEDYLRRTREGMWDDSREALETLSLESHDRILDVGCGTGELSRVLRTEMASGATLVGCDVDTDLLEVAAERGADSSSFLAGNALELPFPDDTFDLVVCQALLINLPDPTAALAEFARVSRDLVAAVEPNNADVSLDSSVPAEDSLERRARRAYLAGVSTDVALGADAREAFETAGLDVCETRRYDHVRTVEPPYSEGALLAARRKATGAGLADDRETLLSGPLTEPEYDELRGAWREMGRTVVEQMDDRAYRRSESVPFYVTVGRV